MSNVIPLHPTPQGSYLATIELWRTPEGRITAKPIDMPDAVIEAHGTTVSERVLFIGSWLKEASIQLLKIAEDLREREASG